MSDEPHDLILQALSVTDVVLEKIRTALGKHDAKSLIVGGGVAYAATSGITNSRSDNVGRLQPTGVQPATITVVVDPTTGSVTSPVPQAVATAQPAAGSTGGSSQGERENKSEHGDD